MKRRPSPNFNDRAGGVAVDYVVLHYTGMRGAGEALARLCDPAAEVSAHYMIDEDGAVFQLVDEAKRAWHAGQSYWLGLRDLNSASVGIELVNPGHEWGYRPFPDAQIAALTALLPGIIARQDMKAATCLLAHSDIAPARKEDPGELFPWRALAQAGFGMWPLAKANDAAEADAAEISAMLGALGYDTGETGKAVLAFQRRYVADSLTGIADARTVAALRALSRMIG